MSKRSSDNIEKLNKKMKNIPFSSSTYIKAIEIGDKTAYVLFFEYNTSKIKL